MCLQLAHEWNWTSLPDQISQTVSKQAELQATWCVERSLTQVRGNDVLYNVFAVSIVVQRHSSCALQSTKLTRRAGWLKLLVQTNCSI